MKREKKSRKGHGEGVGESMEEKKKRRRRGNNIKCISNMTNPTVKV